MQVFKVVFLFFLLLAVAWADMHRFCGDHGDCKHVDNKNPEECCIRGKMNGYHECLPNPKPGNVCPPLPHY